MTEITEAEQRVLHHARMMFKHGRDYEHAEFGSEDFVKSWPDCAATERELLAALRAYGRSEREDFPVHTLVNANDYPKYNIVTFTMHRGTDESGISGEGKVLDGVIFEDGLVVVRWVTVSASQSTVIYDCSAKEGEEATTGFQKFLDIHVRAHPANNTVIEFHVPQKSKFVWVQPQGSFDIDQKRTEEAARYIMWAVQQSWFRFPERNSS
jgi:hypothetical protein